MTIPPIVGPLRITGIARTSGALAKSGWPLMVKNAVRRGGGWWNGRWAGYPSVGGYWCATTRRHRTIWGCCNWLAHSSGIVGNGNCCFEIVS